MKEYIAEILEKSSELEIFKEVRHRSCLLQISYDFKNSDHRFYLTIIDGTKRDKRICIRKCLKFLKKLVCMRKITFDDIYDIDDSLVSDKSLGVLASKMELLLKGCR